MFHRFKKKKVERKEESKKPKGKGKAPVLAAPATSSAPFGSSKQADAMKWANQILKGAQKGKDERILQGLRELGRIQLEEIQNPLLVLRKLVDALSDDSLEWQDHRIKREIAKIAHHYLHMVFVKNHEQGKVVSDSTKQDMVVKVERVRGQIREQSKLANGLYYELDSMLAGMEVLLDDKNKKKENLIEAIELILNIGLFTGKIIVGGETKEAGQIIRSVKKLGLNLAGYIRKKYRGAWYAEVLMMHMMGKAGCELVESLNELQKQILENERADWQILYAGLDSLLKAVQEGKNADIRRQAFFGQGEEMPGLIVYIAFNKFKMQNNWRIREKAAEACILAVDCGLPEIKEKAADAILDRRIKERDAGVRSVLEDTQYLKDMQDALKQSWERKKTEVEKMLEAQKNDIAKLQQTLEQAIKTKAPNAEELEQQLREKREELEAMVNNVEGIGKDVGIVIGFVKDIKLELARQKEQLDSIKQDTKHTRKKVDKIGRVQDQQSDAINELLGRVREPRLEEKQVKLKPGEELFPRIWNVPERNVHFTGRETFFDAIERELKAGSRGAITQAVTAGLGGVGKTQLAIEYSYRQKDDYDMVWWMNAENEGELVASFINLAKEVRVHVQGQKAEEIVNNVLGFLKYQKGWLLVYDNAEDPGMVSKYLPERGGHVLITSRSPHWNNRIELNVFDEKESLALLDKLTGKVSDDIDSARELVEILGNLPLAIAQAGAYIRQTGMPICEYLELFKDERKELWEDEVAPKDYQKTVAVTWKISMEKIEKEVKGGQEAKELLKLCAFIGSDNIPRDLLRSYLKELAKNEKDTKITLALNRAIDLLRHYSMINVMGENIYGVHRLVQAVVRDSLGAEESKICVEIGIKSLNKLWIYDENKPETWKGQKELISHITTISEYIKEAQAGLKEILNLLAEAGGYLSITDPQLDRGIQILEQGVRIHNEVCGEKEDEELARLFNNLGLVWKDKGNLNKAVEYMKRAVRIDKKMYGLMNGLRAQNLGVIWQEMGNLDKAIRYYEGALGAFEKIYGPESSQAAIVIYSLGGVWYAKKKLDEAIEYYERALEIDEKTYGAESPQVATVVNGLGLAWKDKGDLDKAIKYHERALKINEKTYGLKHPTVAIDLSNLGGAWYAKKKLDEAIEYYERALKMFEKAYGLESPQVAMVVNNLGRVWQDKGGRGLDEAIKYYERVLEIDEKTYGAESPMVVTIVSNIGQMWQDKGNLDEAIKYMERALKIGEKNYEAKSTEVATIVNNLGAALYAKGNLDKAIEYTGRALEISEETYGAESPEVIIIISNLGQMWHDKGNLDEAIRYYERALKIGEKNYGTENPGVATIVSSLGRVWQDKGNLNEAIKCMERTLKTFKKTYGINNPKTKAVQTSLQKMQESLQKQSRLQLMKRGWVQRTSETRKGSAVDDTDQEACRDAHGPFRPPS